MEELLNTLQALFNEAYDEREDLTTEEKFERYKEINRLYHTIVNGVFFE